MEQIVTTLRQAEDICHQHGGRLTPKRKQVFELLLQENKARSAYELIDLFQVKFQQKLSPMSAYRILDFLESVHLVHKLNIANKYVACAHIGCDHSQQLSQFLICHQCHRVEEINTQAQTIADIAANVKQSDYQLVSPHIELNCICNNCLAEVNS